MKMMVKKVLCSAMAMAVAMCAASVCTGTQLLTDNTTTVNAAISDPMQYGIFKYQKFDDDDDGTYDYIRISYCNESVEKVEIPSEIDGVPVRIIGYGAFNRRESLKSVTIPDTVTTIEIKAFDGCTGLKNITIPDSVTKIQHLAFENCTNLESVNVSENNQNYLISDGVLFNKDKTELVYVPLGKKITEYVIPDSVTTIGIGAFDGYAGLESVTIPDSVTTIGDDAFRECTSLTSVTIPDSVTKIGGWAFYGCTNLASVTVPDSVTGIGYEAFIGCTSLESISIPANVVLGDPMIPIGYKFFDDNCNVIRRTETTEPTVKGDLSGNGELDLQDAVMIAKSLLGSITFTPEQIKLGDTNGNGKIDLADAVWIAKQLLEK